MQTVLCTPNDTYVIVERVYVVFTTARIGPTMRKVVRHVARTCDVQDVYYDGQRLSSMPNGWQLLMDALRLATISTRPTGEQRLMLAYAGFDNLVTPLPPDLQIPHVPEAVFREHRLPNIGQMTYGRDPIPDVRLFGNPRVPFVSPGGDEPPMAMAVYYGGQRRLEPVPRAEQTQLLQRLGAVR